MRSQNHIWFENYRNIASAQKYGAILDFQAKMPLSFTAIDYQLHD